MADVWVLLLIFVFFAACVGLVRGCDRIMGADDGVEVDTTEPSTPGARETETVGTST